MTRHRAAVPVLEHAPGGQDEGILVVHRLDGRDVIERSELTPSTREGLGEQEGRAGVILVPDRVLQADFVDALVGHT
ncbi:MAG: hypothetical protein WBL25_07860, partial [Anaerolineales bacterium]